MRTALLRSAVALFMVTLLVSGSPPIDDCAFRKLAVQMASRNLNGNPEKLKLVARGLNASDCPGGDKWASELAEHAVDGDANATSKARAPLREGDEEVFVSPSGNDANPGTLQAPLRTLRAAQMWVRRRSVTAAGRRVVHLRGGTYYETLLLGPQDSGCRSATSAPDCAVVWQSYPGETAIISGGQVLDTSGCKIVKMNSSASAFSCPLPPNQLPFMDLFVNGMRLQRARYPNGDPSVPCNGPEGCDAAGYTSAGQSVGDVGSCAPNASALQGAKVIVRNGNLVVATGITGPDASATPVNLTVSDMPYAHDGGAFQNYMGYGGGGVSCYNNTYNKPFWNAGSCNCHSFAMTQDDALRASQWQNPGNGVVRMFHTSRWGGWAFQVLDVPHPPQPQPGWSAWEHCTSCLPHNPILKEVGTTSLEQCQAACESNSSCKFINFAIDSNQYCDLFSTCDSPWTRSDCKGLDWWSTMAYNRPAPTPLNPGGGMMAPAPWAMHIAGGQQTGQQGPTHISGNDYFVENIKEELDTAGEFFLEMGPTPTLFVIPPNGTGDIVVAKVEASISPRVVQFRGANATSFAHDIVLQDVTVVHSAPT